MKSITVSVLLILASSVGQGQVRRSGNELLDQCSFALADDKTQTEAFKGGYCIGLVVGVRDVLQMGDQIDTPEGYTTGQGVRVVMKYLQDHPEELADRDSTLVVRALTKAFPVKK